MWTPTVSFRLRNDSPRQRLRSPKGHACSSPRLDLEMIEDDPIRHHHWSCRIGGYGLKRSVRAVALDNYLSPKTVLKVAAIIGFTLEAAVAPFTGS